MNEKKKKNNNLMIIIYVIVFATTGFDLYYLINLVIKKQEITIKDIAPMIVAIILIIFVSNYYYSKTKPRASAKWRDQEQGSNEFQTDEEKKEFLNKCTDNQIELKNEEISRVLQFLGEKV